MRKLEIVALAAAALGPAAARHPHRTSRRPKCRRSLINHILASNWLWRRRPFPPGLPSLSGAQDSQRTKDGLATAAAIVVFWPAAFFVGGD